MYIYHALANTLNAHMIHINLNMIFYTHEEHSPTKTSYIKYYTEKHTHTTHTTSRNWVLILVGMKIPSVLSSTTSSCCGLGRGSSGVEGVFETT